MLVCIDHGNKQIKTTSRTFTSGLMESDTRPPFGDNIMFYNGKYYTLSDQRIPYIRDKTEDDRFFILTLFAIAYEINAAGRYAPDQLMDIQLAVGLPPAHYGTQYKRFAQYFLDRGMIGFEFNGKVYSICITEAICFPQALAATAPVFKQLQLGTVATAIVIDIGGFTADYLSLRYGAADWASCDSLENGIITLYNRLLSKIRADYDLLLEETDIDAGFVHRLIADAVSRFTPLADSRAASSHFCDDTALQPPHFRFDALIVSFFQVSLGLKLQIPWNKQCHISLQYQLRCRWVSRPKMTPDAVEDQVAVLCVWRRRTGENMVLPEISLQRDQFLLIVMVAVNMPDDDFIFIVAVQAAVEDLVNIHHGHVVPPLGLIVQGNDLLPVLRPPVILCVVIGRFDLQNSRPAVGKLYKVVNIRQHKRMHRMIENLLDLVDAIPRFYVEYLCHQIFQQMPHLLGYPVALRVVKRHDLQLVIVEIPCRSKRGDPQYGGCVAAADPSAPILQPFFLRKALRADQY